MEIKRNCVLSPYEPIKSTPQNRSSPCELNASSIDACNFSPIMNIYTPEKNRLERKIAHQSSIQTEELFLTTYSSLQTILSQMQLKLASVFLQETEYLKQHEQSLEQEERILTKSIQKSQNIQNQRKQIENEFSRIKDRIELAVIHVTQFQTDGVQFLRALFSDSDQLDEQLSGLISESLASLTRSRIMISSKINDFSQKSDYIKSELTDRELLIHNTQLSITLMNELVNTLHQLNIEHSQDIIINPQLTEILQVTKYHWDINKEIDEIHLLEKEKIQLENEFLEQTLLLENIYTILETEIIN